MYEYFCPLLFVYNQKVKYIIRFFINFKSEKIYAMHSIECNIVKSEPAARDVTRKAS